jgi:hypothetical protein
MPRRTWNVNEKCCKIKQKTNEKDTKQTDFFITFKCRTQYAVCKFILKYLMKVLFIRIYGECLHKVHYIRPVWGFVQDMEIQDWNLSLLKSMTYQ